MKVLLADENSGRAQALHDILHADPGLQIVRLDAGAALLDAVIRHQPDVVLVDVARPDRDALDSVRALDGVRALAVSSASRPIALWVDEDDPALMEAAFEAGVCSYTVARAGLTDARPVLRAAIALYARFQRTQDELARIRRQLEQRGLIDAAKRWLMQQDALDEPRAHRLLQRRAMREQRRLHEVAADILAARDKALTR